MAERRRGLGIGALVLAALLAACGRPDGAPGDEGDLRLSFEDRLAPEVFERQGLAVRDAPDGAAGLWAAVGGLPRPERGRIVDIASGEEVDVALFRGSPGSGIRLSNEAADRLGAAGDPVEVRVTALRQHPTIDQDDWFNLR